MSRLTFFFRRLVRMDWKAMWKTSGLLRERSGRSRLWLLCDMLRCAVRYNAGYMDYKIAQMYRLNDAQRRTQITRGLSNQIVRRMNDKAYWHFFDDKATFNALFAHIVYPYTEVFCILYSFCFYAFITIGAFFCHFLVEFCYAFGNVS